MGKITFIFSLCVLSQSLIGQTVSVLSTPNSPWYTTSTADLTSTVPGSDFVDTLFTIPAAFGNTFRIRVSVNKSGNPFYLYALRSYTVPWDADVNLYLYDNFDNPTVPTLITNSYTLIASTTAAPQKNNTIQFQAMVTDLDAVDVTALTFDTTITYLVRATPLP